MKFKTKWLMVLSLSMILVIGVATVALPQETSDLAEKQILNIGFEAGDMGEMSPFQSKKAQDLFIQGSIFERLVEFDDPGDITSGLIPSLATHWKVSEDGLIWTFYLREGVTFHKGYGEMTAEDVKFTFQTAMDPGKCLWANGPPWSAIQQVRTLGKYTVEIVLKEPLFDILRYLAWPQVGANIVSKKAEEERGKPMRTDLIGTGPFMWEEYAPNDHIALIKNPDYWRGEPILDKIVLNYMPSVSSRTIALFNKELDAILGITDVKWIEQVEEAGMIVDALGPGCGGQLMFNMKRPPLDNWLVRAAIAYAINREDIVRTLGETLTMPLVAPVPYTWLYGLSEGVPEYEYNPELARELLAAAGYPDGFELHSFTSTRDYYKTQFEVIQAQLRVVGIDLSLTVVDHTTFHANQRKGLNDLVISGPCNWTGEEMLYTIYFSESIVGKPTGRYNASYYGELVGSIDEELEAAKGQSTNIKRELYAKAQRQIMVDLPAYPTIIDLIPAVRQPYLNLGYEPKSTGFTWYAPYWEMRILEH